MSALRISTLVILFSLVSLRAADGQDNYEIQVYGSEMGPPGSTMMELHSNFTVLGSTTVKDGVNPTQHSMHETLEITHGFTDWFESGFYIFSSIQPDGGWQWVGDHIRPRLTVPESWQAGRAEPGAGIWLSAAVIFGRHLDLGDPSNHRQESRALVHVVQSYF
ncbi:MAG: hypothetical protein WBQ10_20715 [Terriglobales bacterium]